MAAVDKKAAAAKSTSTASAETTSGGDSRCAGFAGGPYWVTTRYGGFCVSSQAEQENAQHQELVDAQAELAEQKLQQQQADYQRQLLQQQAQYQQQLLQQADIARRQMVLQYMMNMTKPQPYVLPMPQVPAYSVPNNQIHCTSNTLGGTTYPNCN